MDKFLCHRVPSFLWGIYLDVELLGRLVTVFKLLRTVFLSDCTILHSYHQCASVPVPLHPCSQLLFYGFFFGLIVAILR